MAILFAERWHRVVKICVHIDTMVCKERYHGYLNSFEIFAECLLQRGDWQAGEGVLVLVHLPLHKFPFHLLRKCRELNVGGWAALVASPKTGRLLLENGWHCEHWKA